MLYVATDCAGIGASCVGQREGGVVDVDLTAGTKYYVFVDGQTWQDKGPFTLQIEQQR